MNRESTQNWKRCSRQALTKCPGIAWSVVRQYRPLFAILPRSASYKSAVYTVGIMFIVCQMHLADYLTSTIVFCRTRVYQMQPRNSENWHSFVRKCVHQNRDTAKIGFCTSLKSISISYVVNTRDKVNAN